MGIPATWYRQWPPGPRPGRYEPAGGAIIVMCSVATWLRWCVHVESGCSRPTGGPSTCCQVQVLEHSPKGGEGVGFIVRNQAKRLHGPRIALGASTTSPDPAPGDRSERSPPERATGVDLSDRGERSPPERATGVDFERPWRAVSAGASHRSGLGALPSIRQDMYPDLAVWHRKPSLILERSPGHLGTAASDTRGLVTGQRST